VLTREREIEWAYDHQWVVVVLLEHWIGGGRRQRRLTTASRSYCGAPARRSARGGERQCKCGCVNARVSAWELRDVLQVEEEAQRARAGAGKPAACMARSGGGGVTWRGEEGPAEAVGAGAGGYMARSRAVWGSWSSRKRPARAVGSRARAEQRKD
jgi:hypothetical protein